MAYRRSMPETAYLSLGSNLGDRQGHLRDAISRLGAEGQVAAVSSFYETEPVEVRAQPWFLNCAIALETAKTPELLMASILRIEQGMGRRREQKKGPRTIDIDILLFGNIVMATPKLTVPHPAMQERRFVLEPLAEIRPEALHPQFNKTVLELLEALPAGQEVRRKIQPGISTH
jgi:2-amino-4-hydroxy-6-hydroxymethyldihydropteridine diphosphokinase